MHNEITTDIVEGQIQTAEGLLQWIQAEVEMTRAAFSVSPLLLIVNYLLGSIVKKVEGTGVDSFDPEHAGYAASKFMEVSEAIRVMIARSEVSGLYDRLPSCRLFKRVQKHGKKFSDIATALRVIDDAWQATTTQAAQKSIEKARQFALSISEEPVQLFDAQEDLHDSPTDDAIRAQFQRTSNPSPK
jgi:hypothetical protein